MGIELPPSQTPRSTKITFPPILPIPRATARREYWRLPLQPLGVDPLLPLEALLLQHLRPLLHHRVRQHDDVPALAVPEHIEILQRVQHVARRHGGQGADLLDAGLGLAVVVQQHADDGLLPVGAVAQQAQVRQRLLGRAELALALRQLVAEGDEQAAVALALVLRQGQDARHVVALGGLLLLGEVADEVAAAGGAGGHAVEEEGVDVVVERLVVEEQLAQQAQVAAPRALPPPVDLEERHVVVAVDLVAGRVRERALRPVPLERPLAAEVAQAELADVHHLFLRERERVRREVPGFHLVRAHRDAREVAHARDFGLVLCHGPAGAELLDLLLSRVRASRSGGGGFRGRRGVLHVDEVELLVLGFGRVGGDFRGEDGDGGVGVVALVFLAAGKGGSCFRGGNLVAGGGGELGGRGCGAGDLGRATRALLTGFGKGGSFGRCGDGGL